MIVVLGSVVTQEGRTDEALALAVEHVHRSRAEPGCLSHAVHRDAEAPQRLVFVETWASRDALWTHFGVPASKAFGKAMAGLATGAPTLEIYDAVAVPVPGATRPDRPKPSTTDAGD